MIIYISKTEYVDISTGEMLTLEIVKEQYKKIGKTKTHGTHYTRERNRVITTTTRWECQYRGNQLKLL